MAHLPRRLISTDELTGPLALELLDQAERELSGPALAPRVDRKFVVVNAFFEPSTRTRLSFALAAQRLGALTLTITEADASVRKGESLVDTVRTLEALGADVIVLRHPRAGAALTAADAVKIPVVNAGDGTNDHPTQALVDALTLRRRFGRIKGLRIVIVGDLRFGRGAHASVTLLHALGAEIEYAAPRRLRPYGEAFPARRVDDLDVALAGCDAVMVQRVQFERQSRVLSRLSRRAFERRHGLTAARAAALPAHAAILHPGPINRGIEIDAEVADDPRSQILAQVANGVAVRAAVLRWLLTSPAQ